MAFDSEVRIASDSIAAEAGQDLTAAYGKACTLDATGKVVLANGANALGPLERPVKLGDTASIRFQKGAPAFAGAAIARMAQVEVNASGEYITLAAGVAKGRAITSAGAQGEAFTLLIKF